jgi:hypothetical protein
MSLFGYDFFLDYRQRNASNGLIFSRFCRPPLMWAGFCTATRESWNAGEILIFVTATWLQRAYLSSRNKLVLCIKFFLYYHLIILKYYSTYYVKNSIILQGYKLVQYNYCSIKNCISRQERLYYLIEHVSN